MRIASVRRAFPPNRHEQTEIRAALESIWSERRSVLSRLPALHENALVKTRHLALPIEEYMRPRTFGETNDHWIRVSLDLGQQALGEALDAAGLAPSDVDAIFTVSVTGLASPSLDARLVNRMGLRPDVKRTPIFGLGCVGGVAGISRAVDYVRAFPEQVAVLVSVELCSLTFQRDDVSPANLISCGLFGDGAAAVVIVGEKHPRARSAPVEVLATRSVFYPETEDVMGWRVSERGFDIVLSPAVPTIARERLAPDVDRFLADHGLARGDIGSWVCHPGGPKVLRAMQEGLGLADDDVRHSWDTLRDYGNLSSTSALLVLHSVLEEDHASGELGLALAMGPAFCSELVLFRWI